MPITYRPASKYRSKKVSIDGFTFDSSKEGNRYQELKFLEATGHIKELELQKPFVLQEGFRDKNGKWVREIRYICDFYYFDKDKGEYVIEDVKSSYTKDLAVYRIRKKMMMYKGLYITEVE